MADERGDRRGQAVGPALSGLGRYGQVEDQPGRQGLWRQERSQARPGQLPRLQAFQERRQGQG